MTMVHTGERLPTREWQPQSGRPARRTLRREVGKALFSWSLIAEPDESHLIDAETVRDYWKSLGMMMSAGQRSRANRLRTGRRLPVHVV